VVRNRNFLVKAAFAVALLGGAALLSACGGSPPDVAGGKQLFTQRCGACHTLADAGTKGTIGPNLDDAFKQDIADGLGRSAIEGVVRGQIKYPQGPEMPANLVKGNDVDNVAAYVARAIGKKPGGGATGGGGGGPSGTATANARNEVEIPADPTGLLQFKVKSAQAKAGKVTLLSKNDSSVPHDISVKGNGVNKQGPTVSNGKTSKVVADLKPGTYEFYCSVPGHEQAGMKGTLTVK
jgi:uncharacterized cupredoxin-like copper-binding protein/mono/diheme cytochrome c family protein